MKRMKIELTPREFELLQNVVYGEDPIPDSMANESGHLASKGLIHMRTIKGKVRYYPTVEGIKLNNELLKKND